MNRAVVYVLAAVPQFALVAGLAVREEYLLATGTSVVLEVRPYDPMDPLSGRYLGTPLAIESIDTARVPCDAGLAGTVWVVLAPGEPCWQPVAVRAAPPALAPGQVCLRGELEPWRSGRAGVLAVRYAIGRFYIPANGPDPSGRTDLALRVRVGAAGRAAVEDLLVGGTAYRDWNR